GFRTINEMVGRVDKIDVSKAIDHWKAQGLDLSKILYKPEVPPQVGTYCSRTQDHGLDKALDHHLIEQARPALERGEKVTFDLRVKNINRTVGTMLSHEISKRYGEDGLPDDTITVNVKGACGQSFSAFGARGITFNVRGDANDYFGKGLSGAKLIIQPPAEATYVAEENILIGNVAFYGAIKGEAYIRGLAGERFCVRNSGVRTVVEGVGDHGCEYMTGGVMVCIGPTGRNFAAGMSGGIAFIYDHDGKFGSERCNHELVDLEAVESDEDLAILKSMLENHVAYTDSPVAAGLLADWKASVSQFVKIMPRDYRAALERIAREQAEQEQSGLSADNVEQVGA
ncbi:MAG: glutamate synthase subunit alpha, partial [Kiritimatiellae bacterium]|nr:glutamate synthase subunit alpha [Kiritimatiellia bacterium]